MDTATLTHAETLGAIAFAKGLPARPGGDKDLMDEVSEVGGVSTAGNALMRAWLTGWNKANLAEQSLPTPETRARELLSAIGALYDGVDNDVLLRALAADMRHLCDAMGCDHGAVQRAGHESYTREVAEQGPCPKLDLT